MTLMVQMMSMLSRKMIDLLLISNIILIVSLTVAMLSGTCVVLWRKRPSMRWKE